MLILWLHLCSTATCHSAFFLIVQDYTGSAVTAKTFLQVLAGKRVNRLSPERLYHLASS